MSKQTQSLINKYNRSVDSIKRQELAIDKVKNKLDAMKKGDVIPPSLRDLSTQLKQSERELNRVNNQLNKLSSKKITTTADDAKIAELERSKANLTQIISEVRYEINSGLGNSVEVQQLQEHLNLLNSKLQQTKDETNQTANILKNKFNESGNKAQDFAKKVINAVGKGGVTKQFDNLSNKVSKFGKRITRLIGAVAIFNLIRSGLTALRNGFISILKENDAFSQSLAQIKGNLMTAFAPIYNAVLPAINALMSSLVQVTGTIAQFISGLFGISTNKAVNQAKKLSKALGDTNDSAGQLASFDKLEVLSSSNDSGGSSGGDYNYSAVESVNSKLLDTLNKIKELISSGDWSGLFSMLSAGLVNFFNDIALKISEIDWSAIAMGITGAITGIDWLGLALGILSILQNAWSGLYQIFTSIDWGAIASTISNVFHGIISELINMFLNTDWVEIASNIANAIMDFVLGIDWLQLGTDILMGLIAGLQAALEFVIGFFATMLDRILAFFGIHSPSKVFQDIGKQLINGLINGIKALINAPVNLFKTLYSNIKKIFNNITSFFQGIWNSIKKVFTTIGSKIGNAFKSAFEAVINSVIKAAESAINAPIKGINSAIKTINKIPGVEISKMKTIKFPRLAEGAVIPPRQEFMAVLGDQKHGTNIEAPLDTIKQANREVLQEMMNGLPTTNASGELVIQNLTIVNKMGEHEISRTVVKGVRIAEKEYGKSLFVG